MISVNELALDIFEEMAEYPEDYNVAFHQLDNGARIIDCGVETKGGYLAGKRFTEICMGGLGEINFRMGEIMGVPLSFIEVSTDFPSISCLGAQKAGWTVNVGNFFAMGSGPARALSLMPKHTYEVIDYEDECDYAVMALESDKLPSDEYATMRFIIPSIVRIEPVDIWASSKAISSGKRIPASLDFFLITSISAISFGRNMSQTRPPSNRETSCESKFFKSRGAALPEKHI